MFVMAKFSCMLLQGIGWRNYLQCSSPMSISVSLSKGVGEGNETFFIRVWKPLLSRHVLKTLDGMFERESPRKTIFASGELELFEKGVDFFPVHSIWSGRLF